MSKTTNAVPPPGSFEALSHGCTCPELDNAEGKGAYGGEGIYWITAGCPLHAPGPSSLPTYQHPRPTQE